MGTTIVKAQKVSPMVRKLGALVGKLFSERESNPSYASSAAWREALGRFRRHADRESLLPIKEAPKPILGYASWVQ